MEWMLMPLRRYAEFSGRSRRMEFWMWVLFQFLIGCVFLILMMALGGAALMSGGDPGQLLAMGGVVLILYLLYALLALAFFIPSLAVTIRRLHDTERSGWWVMLYWGPYLLMFVSTFVIGASAAASGDPAAGGAMAGGALALVAMLALVVGGLVLLVFMFLEGTKGPNRYGPDPKAPDQGQVFA